MNQKRLASTLCAATFLSVVGLLVASSHSAPANNAQPCVGCGLEKIMIPAATGNADVDRANFAKAWNAAMAVQHNNQRQAVAKQLAYDAKWHGTNITTKPTETDPNVIALYGSIGRYFATDPDAPAAREAAIKKGLGDGRIWNGYYGTIESVTPNENGWKVIIKVSPQFPGLVFTTLKVVEEWQIGNDGSLQNLSCKLDADSLIGIGR